MQLYARLQPLNIIPSIVYTQIVVLWLEQRAHKQMYTFDAAYAVRTTRVNARTRARSCERENRQILSHVPKKQQQQRIAEGSTYTNGN